MQDENLHCMPDNEQTVEDVSMEDAFKNYSKQECTDDIEMTVETHVKNGFKTAWQQREEQLLPIIKELGEALKRIANRTNEDGIFETDKHIAQTTLEKYKNYL